MTSIVITGANGFIGQSLFKRLVSENWKVRGAVRTKNCNNRLSTDIDMSQIEFVDSNTDWAKVLIGVEAVVHLAARVPLLKDNAPDPLTLFRQVNVSGTKNLALKAAFANVRRFIYLSSTGVNGDGRSRPYNEEDLQDPQNAYSISKWEAEEILRKISEETGMEIVILRSPLVYGPKVKANFLRLLKVLEHGIPLPLASVNNRRSLIYLGNLVDAIIACMKHPHAAGQTYFVSDNEDVSTPELIRRISSALGRPVRLFHCPTDVLKVAGRLLGKVTEMERLTGSLTVDISKIMHELGWVPPFSMEQGLRETAKWYKKRTEVRH